MILQNSNISGLEKSVEKINKFTATSIEGRKMFSAKPVVLRNTYTNANADERMFIKYVGYCSQSDIRKHY